MTTTNAVTWNNEIRLAFSDVDDTIAEVYTPATPQMIEALSKFLGENRKLFMVTGGGVKRVTSGITDYLDPLLRSNILISHCSGAEVWGFEKDGTLRDAPFYSLYQDAFTEEKEQRWREIMQQLIDEFRLRPHPVQNKAIFWEEVGRHPLDVLYDDRGPQITIGVPNAVDVSEEHATELDYEIPLTHGERDIRTPIQARAKELLAESDIPISPNFGGTCSLDFAVQGVSKTTSIKKALESRTILESIGLSLSDVQNIHTLEVWGDKYSVHHGGTDRFMSMALPPGVRSIDFRQEDPSEFIDGYNIVLWDGQHHLHHGLLEYLKSRD